MASWHRFSMDFDKNKATPFRDTKICGIHQKSINNPLKKHQKSIKQSIKNPPKIDPGGVLEPLGASKNQSWRRLGASWGILGCLGVFWPLPEALQARPGGVLGRLGGVLVANMVPTWLPKRSQNRVKIEGKIDQNVDASWDRIFERFWSILGAQVEPSWS